MRPGSSSGVPASEAAAPLAVPLRWEMVRVPLTRATALMLAGASKLRDLIADTETSRAMLASLVDLLDKASEVDGIFLGPLPGPIDAARRTVGRLCGVLPPAAAYLQIDQCRVHLDQLDHVFTGANAELVEEGLDYFDSMKSVHNMEPQMRHYGCIVDLLGHAGQLEKALRFITEMPVAPDPVVYRILLGSCKTHGDLAIAEVVTKKLNELDGINSGNYTLMSNTYAGADRWSDAMKVRQWMEDTRVRKSPACSVVHC